jgi:hypothetical protein
MALRTLQIKPKRHIHTMEKRTKNPLQAPSRQRQTTNQT